MDITLVNTVTSIPSTVIYAVVFVFLIGLAIGSFLNVVVFRTREENSIGGRSHCPNCGVALASRDLIPLISYIILRGKCRHCHKSISPQYPLVEVGTALIFTLFFLRYYYGFSLPDHLSAYLTIVYLLRDFIFTTFLIVLFIYDLKYYLILDRFTIPAILLAFFINLSLGVPAIEMLAGALVVGGFFFVQFWLSKGEWIGGGDVRMGILMGVILGLYHGLVALVLAYALGAFVGIFLILSQKAKLKTQVPFGSFLALMTILMMLAGTALMDWYINLIGLPPSVVELLETAVQKGPMVF